MKGFEDVQSRVVDRGVGCRRVGGVESMNVERHRRSVLIALKPGCFSQIS